MAAKNPQTIAAKWGSNLQNSQQSIKDGVNAVQVAPGQLAAAAQATMLQRLTDSITSGRWAQAVSGVTLQQWQQSMLTSGLQNIANGVTKGKPKMQGFLQAFLPFVANVQQQIKALPNATQADRENRMIQNSRLIAAFRKPAGT